MAVVVDTEMGTATLEVLAKKGVAVNGIRHLPSEANPTVASGDIVLVGKTTITVFLKEGTKIVQQKKEAVSLVLNMMGFWLKMMDSISFVWSFLARFGLMVVRCDPRRRKRRKRRRTSRSGGGSVAAAPAGAWSSGCSRLSSRSSSSRRQGASRSSSEYNIPSIVVMIVCL